MSQIALFLNWYVEKERKTDKKRRFYFCFTCSSVLMFVQRSSITDSLLVVPSPCNISRTFPASQNKLFCSNYPFRNNTCRSLHLNVQPKALINIFNVCEYGHILLDGFFSVSAKSVSNRYHLRCDTQTGYHSIYVEDYYPNRKYILNSTEAFNSWGPEYDLWHDMVCKLKPLTKTISQNCISHQTNV